MITVIIFLIIFKIIISNTIKIGKIKIFKYRTQIQINNTTN